MYQPNPYVVKIDHYYISFCNKHMVILSDYFNNAKRFKKYKIASNHAKRFNGLVKQIK